MSLSLKEVARLLAIDEQIVIKHVLDGTLPYRRIGGDLYFSIAELREWAELFGFKINNKELLLLDQKMPLADSVERGGVFFSLPGMEPDKLIQNLIASIHLPDQIQRDFIESKVMEREKTGPTAIGEGIAIPHMHEAMDELEYPVTALAILPQAILWGQNRVNIIFLPCSPNMRIHLKLLMKIASLGKRSDKLRQLAACLNQNEVLMILREIG